MVSDELPRPKADRHPLLPDEAETDAASAAFTDTPTAGGHYTDADSPGRDAPVTDNENDDDNVDANSNNNSNSNSNSNASPFSSLPRPSTFFRRSQWIPLAIASGACAAFNGVFAKLTTTELTTRFAQFVAGVFHLGSFEGPVEVVVRGTFFGLNLVFNGVMWTLFTKALTAGHSSTQVSVLNTSTNFMLTALLGLAIFSEALPPLWWVGATLLVAGNVIIGQKDEGKEEASPGSSGEEAAAGGRLSNEYRDDYVDDPPPVAATPAAATLAEDEALMLQQLQQDQTAAQHRHRHPQAHEASD